MLWIKSEGQRIIDFCDYIVNGIVKVKLVGLRMLKDGVKMVVQAEFEFIFFYGYKFIIIFRIILFLGEN